MAYSSGQTAQPYLQPGDVIYAPGWDFCHEVISGPFCRIHYVQWQGRSATTPANPPSYVSYLIRVLGGTTVYRFIAKARYFQPCFRQ